MRYAILGNSGSGKSTLAKWLSVKTGAAILDLDTIAWMPGQVAVPRPTEAAISDLESFCTRHSGWIVEGCYGNLIEHALRYQPTLLFLNPGEEICQSNCQNRAWEPHKFASREEQDSHLEFLLKWVSDYYSRDDAMSLAGHRACFDRYIGIKLEIRHQWNEEALRLV